MGRLVCDKLQQSDASAAGSPLLDLCNMSIFSDLPAKVKFLTPILCAGFRQLSLTKLVTWPHFRDRVLEQGLEQARHPFPKLPGRKWLEPELSGSTSAPQKHWHSLAGVLTNSKRMLSGRTRRSRDSSSSDECEQHTVANNDAHIVRIVKQLHLMYQWMFETFSALDLHRIDAINIAMDGPIIRKALASGDLEQLWQALIDEADASQEVDIDKFMKVFVKWVGIEDTWAVIAGLQRSRTRMMAGAMIDSTRCYPSKMGCQSYALISFADGSDGHVSGGLLSCIVLNATVCSWPAFYVH